MTCTGISAGASTAGGCARPPAPIVNVAGMRGPWLAGGGFFGWGVCDVPVTEAGIVAVAVV